MCHARGGHTEVGGYGVHEIVGRFNNVIYIKDFVTVRQKVDPAFCSLDPDHANRLMVEMCTADEHFNPNQLLACWCHTHPGTSVTPSGTDWDTFADHNAADWAAMIILGKDGSLGAHIRQKGVMWEPVKAIVVDVDWENMGSPDVAARITPRAWEEEYVRNIWPSARDYHPDFRRARSRVVTYRDPGPRGPRQVELPFLCRRDDDRGLVPIRIGARGDILIADDGRPDDEREQQLDLAQRVKNKEDEIEDLRSHIDDLQDQLDHAEAELVELETEELDADERALPDTTPLITFGEGNEPAPLLRGMADGIADDNYDPFTGGIKPGPGDHRPSAPQHQAG